MGSIAMRIYSCDAPGCKSTCTLSPADQGSPVEPLRKRGWFVITDGSGDENPTIYCPGCKRGKQPTPELPTKDTVRVTVIESSE